MPRHDLQRSYDPDHASRARCRRKSGAQLADFKLPTLTHRNDVSQFLDFLTHISFCLYFPDSVRETVTNIISSPKFCGTPVVAPSPPEILSTSGIMVPSGRTPRRRKVPKSYLEQLQGRHLGQVSLIDIPTSVRF